MEKRSDSKMTKKKNRLIDANEKGLRNKIVQSERNTYNITMYLTCKRVSLFVILVTYDVDIIK